MLERTSHVNQIYIRSATLASVLQIGDSSIVNSYNRAIAVQRERQLFIGDEEDFSKYAFFSRPIPIPPNEPEEPFSISTRQLSPTIRVGLVNVLAFSSSSVLHVGNTKNIQMEARIKHIRQLLPRKSR